MKQLYACALGFENERRLSLLNFFIPSYPPSLSSHLITAMLLLFISCLIQTRIPQVELVLLVCFQMTVIVQFSVCLFCKLSFVDSCSCHYSLETYHYSLCWSEVEFGGRFFPSILVHFQLCPCQAYDNLFKNQRSYSEKICRAAASEANICI